MIPEWRTGILRGREPLVYFPTIAADTLLHFNRQGESSVDKVDRWATIITAHNRRLRIGG